MKIKYAVALNGDKFKNVFLSVGQFVKIFKSMKLRLVKKNKTIVVYFDQHLDAAHCKHWFDICFYNFFFLINVVPLVRRHLSDHLLWFILSVIITHT